MTYFVNERLTGSRLPSIYHGDSFHHRQSIDQMLEEDLGNISNISPDNINSPLLKITLRLSAGPGQV